ncbi:hypothetical protein FACHB389_32810 [Nostoc calcicola FACHB-389]|nr:NACHT domain-containing protein [Nostoc calcicola FACHB-3891]OKH20370.1 hypothetical protein FACHB389_32810 [Nostoc calcicola FACHB-389]
MRLLQYIKKLKSAKNSLKQQRLYTLIFTVTLWLVLSTLPVPSYSQSSTPTPRPVIEQKVRELAKSDVENDISRRNDYAVKLYGKKSPGLKDDEILQIYDDEYTKQLEAKKKNLWEQLKPENGWLVAIFLFFVLIFKDTLTKWVSSFFEAVGNQIYSKLSGVPLLQGVALNRYREELKQKYEKLKISFRPDKPLKLKNIYVPLKVTGTGDNELIDAFQAITKHRRLMVKGSPGSGKTMLLKHIALCYADGRWSTIFNKFQCIPILLELHRLSSSEKTIQEHLEDAFDRDGFKNAKHFVSESLDKGRLLLLFDGLDEVNSDSRERVVNQIKNLLDKYLKCPVLITCRTAVYRGEFDEPVEKTLEVAEFNDQQIRDFLVPWQSDMPEGKSVEQLIQTLHDRPRIMDMARNPLMLTIIAYLYADTPVVLPRSRAEFYRVATDILLEQWHKERNQFEARVKKLILQNLALFFQDNANQQGQDRRSVDWITVESEVRRILPDLNLQPEIDTKPILKEIVERSGLLLAIDGGDRYQFAHLTLQEFFAASQLRDNADGLISRFKADPDAWRETLKLWCGLASDSTNLIREVRSVDPVVAFECLADAQMVDSTLASEIINSFKSRLGVDGNENIVNHAFAAVAADDRRRTDVFIFLKETLENTSETDARRKAAVNALSLTNLPSAAALLTQQYVNLDNIEFRLILDRALIRMGDIAVPEIEKAVPKADVNQVMDALMSIATPSALQALVNFLWSLDENRALRAALLLASLIKEKKHYTMLNACKLPQGYSRQDSFDWIVKRLGAEPVLQIILKQIVYCISKKLKDPVEVIDQLYIRGFDQKLIIPICLIQALEFREFNDSLSGAKLEFNNFIKNYSNSIQNLCERNESTIWGFLIYNIFPLLFLGFLKTISTDYSGKQWVTVKQLKMQWQQKGTTSVREEIQEVVNNLNDEELESLMFRTGIIFDRDKMLIKYYFPNKKKIINEVTYFLLNSEVNNSNFDIFHFYFQKLTDILTDLNPFKLNPVAEWEIQKKKLNILIKENRSEINAELQNKRYLEMWEGKIIINKKLARPIKSSFSTTPHD